MKTLFKVGDQKAMSFIVQDEDMAEFPSGVVHHVYSTFSLARDAEWTTRQFVLEMKDEDEEGIGTLVSVVHHSPALTGEEVVITGTISKLKRHEILCHFEARVGTRLVATGDTGQKILKRKKLEKLFEELRARQKNIPD